MHPFFLPCACSTISAAMQSVCVLVIYKTENWETWTGFSMSSGGGETSIGPTAHCIILISIAEEDDVPEVHILTSPRMGCVCWYTVTKKCK